MAQRVVVIGGGAAGFFGAIACAEANPDVRVVLLEKTSKIIAKQALSGGGRCNVTHHCFSVPQFVQHYPRGGKALKTAFRTFSASDTIAWFQKHGVKLKAEPDGRMFPVTDDSATIVNCLLQQARRHHIDIKTGTGVTALIKTEKGFKLTLSTGQVLAADQVLIATGGSAKAESYKWLQELGLQVVPPVPSLFTFNVPASPLKPLQGVSVPKARVKIAGQKLEDEGPLLITHWGFSGPAVLKLSAWGARTLQQLNYHFTVLINWVPDENEESLRAFLKDFREKSPKKVVASNPLFGLPQRLWKALTELAEIPAEVRWAELPAKNQNKLLEALLRCEFQVKGKTTFKEEFVTCGGLALQEVNHQTFESKKIPGLYFAGEVLDIDGITGGFNFQAAWTTGYLAGKAMAAAASK
ncbi:MAG: NAD(P)/FAD-dependent oxidoreductase [Hymenobacteraceae bacterium]|nr:NAD(P)/FAD-dependent oxidoreductase [Hymenobacteraceae bacterium]MDX5394649.1 NAD(P)/FAD-dependent oxidoreductase [Hymenobacteraceae bacterium]MDX5510680.1 NAD(P)/FAD-dependent oxidoreductase [Hymenobacteraceae bacterium]